MAAKFRTSFWFFLISGIYYLGFAIPISAAPSLTNIVSPSSVALYDKLEIRFDVIGSVASNFHWPYDPGPVTGMSGASLMVGITIDGLFLPPGETDWGKALIQPAFLYQPTIKDRSVIAGNDNSEWIYPVGDPYWLIRFAPQTKGSWQYKIKVQDNSNYPGWTETPVRSFSVGNPAPAVHGFIKVSSSDSRYFEYSDGTPFTGTGINAADAGIYHSEQRAEKEFRDKYSVGKTNFHRTWMDMEAIWSRGTHGWDAWKKKNSEGAIEAADSYRSSEQVFRNHDFSVKLSGTGNYIVQYSDGNQAMAGGFENGKTYRLSLVANLVGLNQTDVVVKLISSPANFDSNVQILGPNPVWQVNDLGNGWKKLETIFTNTQGRFLFKSNKALAVGVRTATGSLYLDEISIGEDLGSGNTGPNVVFKGNLIYHHYMDPISSSNWDDIYSHAERYGLTLKVVISDKQDMILHDIDVNTGIFTYVPGFNSENFYSKRDYKVRRLQEYYWRYLAARWGYSRGIHSWELLNEGGPGDTQLYDQTNHLAETMHKYDRNHTATTSFWNSFPVSKFWGNTAYGSLDYADIHAYISTGWIKDTTFESDEAKYHIDYSQVSRDWLTGSARNMPIVRGEAGIDVLSAQNEQDILANDLNGVWLHNFTWAGLDSGGLYELYWWSNNLRNKPGPDGNTANGLFEIFLPYNEFMSNIPLNAGGYIDIGIPEAGNNRVVGQKNNNGNSSTQAHLWIQDKRHTFKNLNGGNLTGTFAVTGMKPNSTFPVEWWDFNTKGRLNKRISTIASDNSGNISLSLNSLPAIDGLVVTDTAIKIGNYTTIPSTPTATPATSPTPTSTPVPGSLISNLTVYDTANAFAWSIQSNLQSGNTQYNDRTYTWNTVPSLVAGSQWIRTANLSRSYTGSPVATFSLTAPATVYIAFDDRYTEPSWMSGYTDTGQDMVNSEPNPYSLYSASYSSPQTISLGPVGSGSYGMYSVIVKASSVPGDGNGDGHVNGVDYMIWYNHYKQSVSGPANGDYNSSGYVDGVDYMVWFTNYGR